MKLADVVLFKYAQRYGIRVSYVPLSVDFLVLPFRPSVHSALTSPSRTNSKLLGGVIWGRKTSKENYLPTFLRRSPGPVCLVEQISWFKHFNERANHLIISTHFQFHLSGISFECRDHLQSPCFNSSSFLPIPPVIKPSDHLEVWSSEILHLITSLKYESTNIKDKETPLEFKRCWCWSYHRIKLKRKILCHFKD